MRKSRLHRLALLRAAVSVVQQWDRSWGTPFFGSTPSALDVLAWIPSSARRQYDIVDASRFLQRATEKALERQRERPNLEPVYAFFRQHNLSHNDPDAYPRALTAAETGLMRERVLMLSRQMDHVFPDAGFRLTSSTTGTPTISDPPATLEETISRRSA